MWNIELTKQALKDLKKLKELSMKDKVDNLINILSSNPYKNPPPYEKLTSCENYYSRRLNVQHRLVYKIFKDEKIVRIVRMWTHYE